MSLLQMLMLGLGLAADAFAVSVAEGVTIERAVHKHTLRVSVMFGLFQGLMPVMGWLAGQTIRGVIQPYDQWVALLLLVFIGGKMLMDALLGVETEVEKDGSDGLRLVTLAIATSIDALAIGITVTMLGVGIWTPAVVIGLVTACLCAIGVQMGDRIGTYLGRKAEIVGGLVLIGLGV
ncbi:MAG: manganese efflux pump MntP family protein, partial [Planctomycetota bacterium]